MTSLYIDRKNVEVRLDGDAIAFYEKNVRVGTVPIAPLKRIIFHGSNTIETSLLGKLGAKGIGVIILSGRKSLPTLLMPCPHNDASRRVIQYQYSLDKTFCLGFSKGIVLKKAQEQINLLKKLLNDRSYPIHGVVKAIKHMEQGLNQIQDADSIDSLRGYEGHIANEYFSGLIHLVPASLNFTGRNRRPPRDPLNAIFSLGYTLLYSEAALTLYASGLDPYIGFYHDLNFGRQSLACDVMEPIRPIFDEFALKLFHEKILRSESFSSTEQGCFLGKAGRSKFYIAYEAEAEKFRKLLAEHIAEMIQIFRKTNEVTS